MTPETSPHREHIPQASSNIAIGADCVERPKVVLTFSGGLVAACMLKWLVNKGYDVIVLFSNLGQDCDMEALSAFAKDIGASKVVVEDMKNEFLEDYVIPSLQASAVYENFDMLGTALSRFPIARHQIRIAEVEGCQYVAHGSRTGNDQCRFELTYYALNPDIQVLSPFQDADFKEIAKNRTSLLEWYAKEELPQMPKACENYSEDSNIFMLSRWGGLLENPSYIAPEDTWSITSDPTAAPRDADVVAVHFKDGRPIKVVDTATDEVASDLVHMFELLNRLGSKHGIGRADFVINSFVGVKYRKCVECPAGTILAVAHRDIEEIGMDKEVYRIKEMFSPKFAELVYNGFWYSPEMDFISAAIRKSQEVLDGVVRVRLLRGRATPIVRESPTSLLNGEDAMLHPSPQHIEGYIQTQSLRLKAHAMIMDKMKELEGTGQQQVQKHRTTAWKEAEGSKSSYHTFWSGVFGKSMKAKK